MIFSPFTLLYAERGFVADGFIQLEMLLLFLHKLSRRGELFEAGTLLTIT